MTILRMCVHLVAAASLAACTNAPRVRTTPAAAGQQAATSVKWDVWPDVPLGAADRQQVLDLARQAGVTPDRVSSTMDSAPMGCPVLLVESVRVRSGQQLTWTSLTIRGRTPKAWRRDCEPKQRNPANTHHPWSVARRPIARTEWVFEDGAWQHALSLSDVPYEEALPLVLALHRNEVDTGNIDKSRVPVGAETGQLTAITRGLHGRWALHIGHTYGDRIFYVDLRDGRYVMIASAEVMV